MPFNPAVNRYVTLVHSKPGLILSAPVRTLDPELRRRTRERAASYSRIICELGSGSGGHLIERAAADPNTLYIGFELRYKRSFRTAEKAEQRGLTNLLVLRTKAQFIREIFDENSIDGFYVNFPDPWDKKRRWEKHRLLTAELIEGLAQIGKPEAFFAYKTDHPECFAEVHRLFQGRPQSTVEVYTEDLHSSSYAAESVSSEFEKLFCSKRLPIYYLRARLKS